MGTLTAGIKEIFSSAKTTGTNVMLCGNDGTPDGHMTMANLANVLGVVATLRGDSYDLNNLTTSGTWRVISCRNAPTGYGFVNVISVNAEDIRQTFYNIYGSELPHEAAYTYSRNYVNNAWTSWIKTTTA